MRTAKLFSILCLTLIGISLAHSCSDNIPAATSPVADKGVSLAFHLSAEDLMAGNMPTPTRADGEPATDYERYVQLANERKLTSLLLLVVKHHPDHMNVTDQCYVVGYRILIAPDPEDDKKYLYKNIGPTKNRNTVTDPTDPNSGTNWPNVELKDVGGQHCDEDADESLDDTDLCDSIRAAKDPSQAASHQHSIENYCNFLDLENKRAAVFVDHSEPLHDEIEVPHPGVYELLFLANFNDAQNCINIPWPDAHHSDLTLGQMITVNNDPLLQLPAMNFPGMPLGYHVQHILAYWQHHKDDADFKGVPMQPCYDEGAMGLDGPGGTPSNWFVGTRSLIDGRLTHTDVETYIPGGMEPPLYFPTANNNNQISGGSYLWRKDISQLFTRSVEMEVTAGLSVYALTLKRPTARFTFTVNNLSNNNARIKDFHLSDDFAQCATPLLLQREGYGFGMTSEYTPGLAGNVDVVSDRALKPFEPNQEIPSNTSQVFFDALMFPAKNENVPHSFTVTVEMDGYAQPHVPAHYELHNRNYDKLSYMLSSSDWSVGASKQFLLKNLRKNYTNNKFQMFIYKPASGTPKGHLAHKKIGDFTFTDSTGIDLSEQSFVWDFEKVNDTQLYIKNGDSYLKTPTVYNETTGGAPDWEYTTLQTEAALFKLNQNPAEEEGSHIAFELQFSDSQKIFIHTNWVDNPANTEPPLKAMGKWQDAGSRFEVYEVEYVPEIEEGTLEKLTQTVNVPIYRLLNNKGEALPMTSYSRGDHIHVNLDLDYSPYKQDLEIGVNDWHVSDNEVLFE